MHSLAQRVLSHVRQQELLRAGDRVGIAVSGGIDSVALLRLLLELRGELGIALSVVHFNHKLRGAESDADQQFAASLACAHDLEFHADGHDVARQASDEHVSIETAARELRYGFFRRLLGEEGAPQGLKPLGEENPTLRGAKAPLFHHLDKVCTGHTLDDQAETVLMRLIRGSGWKGLGGIHPRLHVENENGEVCGAIVRPVLAIRRQELEQYLKEIGQSWREDSSNADVRIVRNRVRQLVVPLLESQFNPAVAGNLAELAEIARGEEDYWENEIAGWMGTTVHWSAPDWPRMATTSEQLVQIGGAPGPQGPEPPPFSAPGLVANASVDRLWFLAEPVAVQRRLVKAIGEHAGIPLEFKHVEEILRFAAQGSAAGKELSLPLGWKFVCQSDALVFVTPDLRAPAPPVDYEYEISIPGRVVIAETGSAMEVFRVPAAAAAGYNRGHLLDAESVIGPLRVRNWRPGDRFWPAHTKSPKKIKELLQERRVAQPERRLWPVVVSGDSIIWVRGFPSAAQRTARPGRDAISILETPSTKTPK